MLIKVLDWIMSIIEPSNVYIIRNIFCDKDNKVYKIGIEDGKSF